nr:hypothetical protein [uncultured Cohaesibacter sp.]
MILRVISGIIFFASTVFVVVFNLLIFLIPEYFSATETVSGLENSDLTKPPVQSINRVDLEKVFPAKESSTFNLATCEEYATILARDGKPNAVACNSKTGRGFFWQVVAPRKRAYGYWGLSGVGEIPSCTANADLEKRAETATFPTAAKMWEVREYWCRNDKDGKCSWPQSEGPIFQSNEYYAGVFEVICKKQ